MKEKTKAYIQLTRPYGYFITITIILGAICNNEFNLIPLLILLVIGLFIHMGLMVQNDYFDIEIDKKSKYVSKRPLVTGLVSEKSALFLWVFFFLLSIILSTVFFPKILSFISLIVSILLITLYNKYSKSFPGMEYIAGGAAFFCVFYGALSVADTMAPLVLFVALLAFIKYVFNVGVSANIKDLRYDKQFDLKTTPMLFGVNIEDDVFYIPKKFVLYAFCIKLTFIGIAMVPFILNYVSYSVYGYPIPIILFVLCSLAILCTIPPILSTASLKRNKMIFYAAAHELLSYSLMPILLMSFLVENLNLLVFLLFIFVTPAWTKFSLKVFFEKGRPNE